MDKAKIQPRRVQLNLWVQPRTRQMVKIMAAEEEISGQAILERIVERAYRARAERQEWTQRDANETKEMK